MKQTKRFLTLLCAVLLLIQTLAACRSQPSVGEDTGATDTQPADSDGITLPNEETTAQAGNNNPAPSGYDLSYHLFDTLPRIDIRTDDGKIDFATQPNRTNKWDYVDCSVSVSNCDEAFKLSRTDAQVKVRGNYTADYEKKPFRIKFTEKQNLLGLNDGAECKSWVLLADWKDSSMLRNTVALFLGQTLLGSDGYYSSDFCNVELYINGEYWGMYLLVEQQQVNDERVDIFEPEEGYTGTDIGYFVEYDAYYDTESQRQQFAFRKPYGRMKGIDGEWITCSQLGYSIKSDIYSQDQRNFIARYVENVFDICYSAVYENEQYKFNSTYTALTRTSGKSVEEIVSAVIDVDSLVDMYILQEICCDYDIHWSSFFMSVDMSETGSKKLTFEAPWDFDSALGIKDACKTGTGFYAANRDNPWLLLFVNEDWFMDRVKAKWQEAKAAGVFDEVLEMIRAHQDAYTRYYSRNYGRWPNMGMNVGGELVPEAEGFHSQSDAADYLYKWLRNRIRFLDQKWGK